MNHKLMPLLAGLTLAASSSFAAPPVAPVRDTPETMHGVTVHDPYRYMENVKDPEVLAWMKGQGDYARSTLDAIPGRDAILKRIVELTASTGDVVGEVQRFPGGKTFFMKRVKGERQYKLMLREAGHKDRVLVDPQKEQDRTGVPHAVNWFTPSWDGQYIAYGMSSGGSEQASLYILNVKTGAHVGKPIPRVNEGLVSWLPDSKSITYNQLRELTAEDPETEFYLDSKVMWLKLGAPESEAKAVFGPTVTRQLGLVRLDVAGITFSPGSQWMIARTTDTTLPEGNLFVARVSELGQGDSVWKQIAKFDDKIVEIDLKGDALYVRSHKDAPRYKVMKLDLRDAQLAKAKDVALPPEGGVLESFVVGKNELMAQVREGASIVLRRYDGRDVKGRAVPLPMKGAAHLVADPARANDDWMYHLASWTRPQQILRLSGDKSVDAGLSTARKPEGVPDLEVTDVKCTSWDGAQVPMTLLHRKGLPRDGSNPTLLMGYGSYGISETAYFDSSAYAWFERGGVIAHVNVRGSGVYGDTWRYAGFKTTKSNTWKDGVACAQYLIAQGYASPQTMAGWGGSAGGIFVGRMVTSAPQLFAAAVAEVGDLDSTRAEFSANGVTNISEFGTVKDPKEFAALMEMSTYQNIKDGTAYPAVMFIHGMNDPRVDVWNSGKAAARLQAATTSGKPVLLRLDAQAGHGIGSTVTQRQQVRADMYAFLLWQMGKLPAR
ncbi:MAG TPA: prolyl oligopeptidase family serine peptidase [Ramlibacter sp.]|nr:prolyl oligopeptidase family serine peptidase [Ramlibacter sp.]